MPALATKALAGRLGEAGFVPYRFGYSSLRQNVAANAARLQAFLTDIPGPVVHLVGQSLGGLIIRRLFEDFPAQRPGRIVLLGSPVGGSAVARRLAVRPIFRRLFLGRSAGDALLHGVAPWPDDRQVGMIAGTLAVGAGRLLGITAPPSDGTVAVAETRLPGLSDHIQLPASHTGLLFSRQVAEQVAAFLHDGRFHR